MPFSRTYKAAGFYVPRLHPLILSFSCFTDSTTESYRTFTLVLLAVIIATDSCRHGSMI